MNRDLNFGRMLILTMVPIVGFGIFDVANLSARAASTTAWLAIVLAGVLILPSVFMLNYLSRHHEGMEITAYAQKILGKHGGHIVSYLYLLFYTIFFGFLVSYFSYIVKLWILPDVNLHLIAAFLIIVCMLTASKDFTSVLRLVCFVSILAILAMVVMRTAMFFIKGDLNRILPLFEAERLNMTFVRGVLKIFPFFFGVGVLAVIPQKRKRGASGGTYLAVGVAVLLLILAASACISLIGVKQTAIYRDAMVMSMKQLNFARLNFTQRTDILFIITWTAFILCASAVMSYIPKTIFIRLHENADRPLFYLIYALLLFLLSLIPQSLEQVMDLIWKCCMTLGVLALFVLPLLLIIVMGVKTHGKR